MREAALQEAERIRRPSGHPTRPKLKEALVPSAATFKVVALGNQRC